MRIATRTGIFRITKRTSWQPTLTCVLQRHARNSGRRSCSGNPHLHAYCNATCADIHDAPPSGNPHSHAYCNPALSGVCVASDLATRTHMRIATTDEIIRCKNFSLATRTHMRIATLTVVDLSSLLDWQPALTCVLQRQKCTILQHAEFVNAGLFVHGYLLSLGLKKSRRVSTEYRSEKHFLLRILSAKIRVCIS